MPYCFICNQEVTYLDRHFKTENHKNNRDYQDLGGNPTIYTALWRYASMRLYNITKTYHKIDEFIK